MSSSGSAPSSSLAADAMWKPSWTRHIRYHKAGVSLHSPERACAQLKMHVPVYINTYKLNQLFHSAVGLNSSLVATYIDRALTMPYSGSTFPSIAQSLLSSRRRKTHAP